MGNLNDLIAGLSAPGVAWEGLVLVAALAAAYLACRWAGRNHAENSVWFGRGIVDGLLFPLLALALVYTGELVLARSQGVALLKIAVPVLMSLAGIRFLARVLTVVFPQSGGARLVERVFSWVAWVAAVVWITGLWPSVSTRRVWWFRSISSMRGSACMAGATGEPWAVRPSGPGAATNSCRPPWIQAGRCPNTKG